MMTETTTTDAAVLDQPTEPTTSTSPTLTATILTENAIRKRLRREGRWLRKSRSLKAAWLYRTGEIGSNIADGEAVSLHEIQSWVNPPRAR